jgi:hypothetical protein
MGTWFYHKQPGESMRDFIVRNEFSSDAIKIVASAIYLREAYFAIRVNQTGAVVGVVVTIEHSREGIGLKVMAEDVGPYYWNAPAKILDALTETDNQSAIRWRDSCRKVLQRKSTLKDLVGKTIKIGSELYRVTKKIGRCYQATCESNGITYRVRPRDLSRATVQ